MCHLETLYAQFMSASYLLSQQKKEGTYQFDEILYKFFAVLPVVSCQDYKQVVEDRKSLDT